MTVSFRARPESLLMGGRLMVGHLPLEQSILGSTPSPPALELHNELSELMKLLCPSEVNTLFAWT